MLWYFSVTKLIKCRKGVNLLNKCDSISRNIVTCAAIIVTKTQSYFSHIITFMFHQMATASYIGVAAEA